MGEWDFGRYDRSNMRLGWWIESVVVIVVVRLKLMCAAVDWLLAELELGRGCEAWREGN
jgi:hypothetical protein